MKLDTKELAVVASRMTSLLLGPATILAVGLFLDPVLQGFYYTFGSVLAATMFFEAGVSTAIVQFAAHEASGIKLVRARIADARDESMRRLAAILRFSLGWFWCLSAIMGLGVGAVGVLVLSNQESGVDWLAPWCLLVVAAVLNFLLQPFFVFLEGVGRLAYVYTFRTARGLLQSSVLVVCIVGGAGLYSLALANLASFLLGVAFVLPNIRLVRDVMGHHRVGTLSWRTEILPFQWRLAASWAAGYFTVSMFTPALMMVRGPVEAGQMGMSVSLFVACTSVAASFIQAHAPRLGELAGASAFEQMHALFVRKSRVAILVAFVLIAVVVGGVAVGEILGVHAVERVIPAGALALLGVGFVAYHIEGVLAFFMRAQKREPYFLLEVVAATLILPSTILLGNAWGVWGVAAGFAVVHVLVILPAAWIVLRRSVRRVIPRVQARDV